MNRLVTVTGHVTRTLEVGSVRIQSVTEGSIFTKPDLVLGS